MSLKVFHSLLTFLPEVILLLSLLVQIGVKFLRNNITPKTFYTISKCAFVLTILAISFFEHFPSFPFWDNDPYIALFKIMILIVSWGVSFLSLRWFFTLDKNSFRFYFLVLLSLLCFFLALSFKHIGFLMLVLAGYVVVSFFFFKTDAENEDINAALKCFLGSAVFVWCLACGAGWFLTNIAGGATFSLILNVLKSTPEVTFSLFCSCAVILCLILFLLAVAPFHFWSANLVKNSSLPVATFLMLVPPLAFYALLVKLLVQLFYPIVPAFSTMLLSFAALSMIIGLIGAIAEKNLRKIFAFVSLFNLGIVFSELAFFDVRRLYGSFIYLMAYLLALSGVYTLLFGLKSKGVYLNDLKNISGLSSSKPLLAAAMLVFLISMLGLPPTTGFLGLFSVLNGMASLREYWLVALILLGKLLMAYAYLKIIKVMYFEQKITPLDRTDKSIYICLIFNIGLMIAITLNPQFFLAIVRNFLN